MKKNAFYAQSGGPTSVINASACGIIEEARKHSDKISNVYVGRHGIVGALNEDLIDTAKETSEAIHALRYTPAAAFGSCRHKLKKISEDDSEYKRLIEVFEAHNISYFFYNGGNDSQDTTDKISQMSIKMGYPLTCVGIPKTIDNDLPLEQNTPTFGFQTAVDFAYEICKNYRKDAQTTGRWFFVTVMGRTAGHLALALGSALGAEITLIPEEFKGKTIKLGHIYDILTTSIIKAMAQGQNYGIAVIAEGIAALIDDAQWETLANEGVKVEHDDAGHLRIAEIPLASILSRHVVKQLSEMGIKLTITPESVGYTLRTQDPNAFDSRYVSILGNAAMSFALFKESGLVYYRFSDDSIRLIPFDQIFDKTTGRTAVRLVNTNGASYIIAQETMTRIRFNENQESVAAMAREAKMTSTEFAGRFGYLIQ